MKKFVQKFIQLYTDNRLAMSSAALSYYLTMTFFPLAICLYTMLGRSADTTDVILDFIESVMPVEAVEYLRRFLGYVAANYSIAMMLFALSVILISASAACRSMQVTIGRMQGGLRYYGTEYFVLSVIFSLVFLIVIYAAIIVMFFTRNIVGWVDSLIKLDISNSWFYMRYVLLFGIAFLFILLVYRISRKKGDHYNISFGAFVATLALIGVTYVFSIFINYSVKYPLVYGSLAAIILLMFWLYTCSLVIYCGAAINVARRDRKREKLEEKGIKVIDIASDNTDDMKEKSNT